MVKIVYDLPFETHKRFTASLTDFPHLQSILHGRYIGFAENLKKSNKNEIKLLYNMCSDNFRSNTGRNLSYLMKTYKADTLNDLFHEKHNIKLKRVHDLKPNEEWKPKMIKELTLAIAHCGAVVPGLCPVLYAASPLL